MADITNVLKILPDVSEMLYQMYKDETDKESISVRYDQYLAVDDAIELLKERNWVKCSDRMPEEHDSIFAKLKDTDKWHPSMFEKSSDDVRVVEVFGDGTRRVYHSHTIDGKWDIENFRTMKRTVTHWMPNPELPFE